MYDADYDNVKFEEYHPMPTNNLVIGNGDADDGIVGFGTYNAGSILIKQEPNGNNYFHNVHRTASWHGMKAKIDTSQLVEGTTYRISWKFRTYSESPDKMRTQLSWKRPDNTWGHMNLWVSSPSLTHN